MTTQYIIVILVKLAAIFAVVGLRKLTASKLLFIVLGLLGLLAGVFLHNNWGTGDIYQPYQGSWLKFVIAHFTSTLLVAFIFIVPGLYGPTKNKAD